jgi:hypothetical protein
MFDAILGAVGGLLQQPNVWLFFVLFFLFILIAYRVVKVLIRAAMIAVVAGLFPFFGNMFLGLSIPINLENILWFAITGVEMYFVYHLLVNIGKLAEIITKPFKRDKTRKVERIVIKEKVKDKDERKE